VNLKYIVSEETNYNMPNNYLFECNTSEIEKQINKERLITATMDLGNRLNGKMGLYLV
jgi:hypothetical protein